MNFWKSIDNRRKAIDGLSRAEMCRRAGISESTVTKGMARGVKPIPSTRRAVEAVLLQAEAERAAA
mgnify:CR=1 FL=1